MKLTVSIFSLMEDQRFLTSEQTSVQIGLISAPSKAASLRYGSTISNLTFKRNIHMKIQMTTQNGGLLGQK